MCAWASAPPFLPHNSATIQFQVLMSMQMGAEFKKEQIGTLSVWVGALEGGFGGWMFPSGCPPQKYTCLPKNKKLPPDAIHIFYINIGQNRMYTSCMTSYLVISLPIILYIHRTY